VKQNPPRRQFDGPIHGRIAELREKKKLTQEQLAKEIGVHVTAVSHWETGFARPDMGRLPVLAKALGVSVDQLIRGEEAA